jgi:hypothetical protein
MRTLAHDHNLVTDLQSSNLLGLGLYLNSEGAEPRYNHAYQSVSRILEIT